MQCRAQKRKNEKTPMTLTLHSRSLEADRNDKILETRGRESPNHTREIKGLNTFVQYNKVLTTTAVSARYVEVCLTHKAFGASGGFNRRLDREHSESNLTNPTKQGLERKANFNVEVSGQQINNKRVKCLDML